MKRQAKKKTHKIEMTELVDKNFKTAIINILHTLMKVGHDIRRKVEGIRNTQNELLEMQKNTMAAISHRAHTEDKPVTDRTAVDASQDACKGSRSGRGGAELQGAVGQGQGT